MLIKPLSQGLKPNLTLAFERFDTRPILKLATKEQTLGAYGAEDRSVFNIHEDLSTGAIRRKPLEVEFRNRSTEPSAIYMGYANSPVGRCFVAWTGNDHDYSICFLAFVDNSGSRNVEDELKTLWPNASLQKNQEDAQKIISKIFDKDKAEGGHRLLIKGTEFQEKVWRTLTQIDFGTVIYYQDLASLVGGKNFTRASASAIAKNNISYLIPCHRVVSKSGAIKYRWGSDFKQKLLEWEKGHSK